MAPASSPLPLGAPPPPLPRPALVPPPGPPTPAILPLLRTAGSPISAAVSDATGHLAFSVFDECTPHWVDIAPIEIMALSSVMPVRPGTLRRSIRGLGGARRSFIIGIRLWPPA